jgi:hypothetical protein
LRKWHLHRLGATGYFWFFRLNGFIAYIHFVY